MRILSHHGYMLLVSLMTYSSSYAANWAGESSVGMGVSHNDNIHLSPSDSERSVSSGNFRPSIKLKNEDQASRFSSNVDLNLTRYNNEPDLERNEGQLNLDWLTATERSNFSINGGYSVASNLESQLELAGITDNQVDRNTASISPRWYYMLSEQFVIDISYRYQDVSFDEPGYEGLDLFKAVNYIDYRLGQLSLSLIDSITEKDKLSLTLSSMNYSGESNGLQIDGGFLVYYTANERELDYTYQVMQLGYEHEFERNQRFNFNIGVSKQEVENRTREHLFDSSLTTEIAVNPWQLEESSKRGKVFNVSYVYQHETGSTSLSLGRDRVAESTGGLVEQDKFTLSYNNRVTELFSWAISVDASKRKADTDTSVVFVADRTNYSLSPSLSWGLGQHWRISSSYRYSELQIEDSVDDRSSNSIMLNLSWHQPQLF